MSARKDQPTGRCTVCGHTELSVIELKLAGGASRNAIGREYGLTRHALTRHWDSHVTDNRKASLVTGPLKGATLANRVLEESESVLDHYKAVRTDLHMLFKIARDSADIVGSAMLAGRLHENFQAMAKLTGQLQSSPLVQINNQQINNGGGAVEPTSLAAFRTRVANALRPFPEAWVAVLKAFEAHEQSPVSTPQLSRVEAA